ncbi:glucan endo-1 3-beta-glucosidase 5 [Phtheirospermum japonicum]|uniref:Glucan endo-1 3-beta-glucosidase 5 n=1 Tax=Phtheirospermum japonicum TaxID=374723 RepID=A0A830B1T4_9LAMI|nr:glucan endo-1 3-beta-glucosidase 5 [Phtheirospermum japonicum]
MVANTVDSIGANWGTQATHPLHPTTIAKLLRDNGIQKLKLFDAEARVLNALSGSGIEVMVGIPNDMLATLAASMSAAERWVERNVSAHVSSNNVDIRYVAVGNEPFLSTYNGTFLSTTLPALENIQAALPSSGDFRTDIHGRMMEIAAFLSRNGAPFTVNIYPFISLYNDPSFPVDYAFFDGYSPAIVDNGATYTNVFDANHDTLVWALQNNGFANLTIIVGEIGWPTDGDRNANAAYAQRFNQGFMAHVSGGTPMRPGPIDAYLFSLVDEDAKSIQPGNFERHWGIFYYDGTPKYNLSLRGPGSGGGLVAAGNVRRLPRRWCVMAPSASLDDPQLGGSVSYACDRADCTSLGYGTSCGNLDARGNVSYAFNSYYQKNDQLASACGFPDNLSAITTSDPSTGTCRFDVMIETPGRGDGGFSLEPLGTIVRVLVVFLWALL